MIPLCNNSFSNFKYLENDKNCCSRVLYITLAHPLKFHHRHECMGVKGYHPYSPNPKYFCH